MSTKTPPRHISTTHDDEQPKSKFVAPRQVNGEGSHAPVPIGQSPKSPGRFSNGRKNDTSNVSNISHGTSLLVDGMSTQKSPRNASSSFKSSTTVGDAHIKALSSQYSQGQYGGALPGLSPRGGAQASFRSTTTSDRDAHIRDLSNRAYATTALSPDHQRQDKSESSFYRSKSPIADAHIRALGKPTDASYNLPGAGKDRGSQSSFKSSSSIADAHIKAVPKPVDASYNVTGSPGKSGQPDPFYRSGSSIADAHIKALGPRNQGHAPLKSTLTKGGATASFKSTTSIGDAHIKAVPKPVDTCVAYKN